MSLSKKYEMLYRMCRDLDESFIPDFLQQMQDEGSILKADLSYLLSLTKNKAFIPALDSAITKLKQPPKSMDFRSQ